MNAVASIEVPKGSPDALRQTAGLWEAISDALERNAGTIGSTSSAVSAADWRGDASQAYVAAATGVGETMTSSAETLRDAAHAARRFANRLEDAQGRARRAVHRAEDALDAISAAQRQQQAAADREATAHSQAAAASTAVAHASIAGPTAAVAVANAQDDFARASNAASVAQADGRRAAGALRAAQDDLDHAQRDGHQAMDDAAAAGRAAAAAFQSDAQLTPGSYLIARPAVPVSLRGASPDLSGLYPAVFAPFGALAGRSRPGEVRAAQIARERVHGVPPAGSQLPPRAPAQDRAHAGNRGPTPPGNATDRFGGMAAGAVGFHLFGNPNTIGYRHGEKLTIAASLIPTPGAVAKLGERGIVRAGEKVIIEGAEHGAVRAGATGSVQSLAKRYRAEAVSGTTKLENNALRDMENEAKLAHKTLTKPAGTATHHIVPKGEYSQYGERARAALHDVQARLARAGIGPDDGANGAFMKIAEHRRVHTTEYFEELRDRLQHGGTDPEALRVILRDARDELVKHGRLQP
jgi:uncharacterized protein YukE